MAGAGRENCLAQCWLQPTPAGQHAVAGLGLCWGVSAIPRGPQPTQAGKKCQGRGGWLCWGVSATPRSPQPTLPSMAWGGSGRVGPCRRLCSNHVCDWFMVLVCGKINAICLRCVWFTFCLVIALREKVARFSNLRLVGDSSSRVRQRGNKHGFYTGHKRLLYLPSKKQFYKTELKFFCVLGIYLLISVFAIVCVFFPCS